MILGEDEKNYKIKFSKKSNQSDQINRIFYKIIRIN